MSIEVDVAGGTAPRRGTVSTVVAGARAVVVGIDARLDPAHAGPKKVRGAGSGRVGGRP